MMGRLVVLGGFVETVGTPPMKSNCARAFGPQGLAVVRPVDQSTTKASFSFVAGSPSSGKNVESLKVELVLLGSESVFQLSSHSPQPSHGFSSYSNGVMITSGSRMSTQLAAHCAIVRQVSFRRRIARVRASYKLTAGCG